MRPNFSCPGDSTHRFVEGGCWYIPAGFPLHDGLTYHAQLEAVEAFLRGTAGDVGAITISLGSNDVVGLLNSCRQASDPDACIRAGASAVTADALAHWATILDRLQSLAPDAVVLALVSDDIGALLGDPPAVSEWWADYTAQVLPLLEGRGVIPIDLSPKFTTADARTCQLTGLCNPLRDVHPSDAGYELIGEMQLRAIASACGGR